MDLNSKKTSLLISGATAIVLSRSMFALFNDPEGPNLLIVIVMAAIVYLLSLAVCSFIPSIKSSNGSKKLSLMILAQIIIVAVFYFFLN